MKWLQKKNYNLNLTLSITIKIKTIMKYYIAKVKVVTTDDKGRQKKIVEQYCVHAVSVTDAEAKVHEEFKNDGLEFEVTHVNETKIIKVIS